MHHGITVLIKRTTQVSLGNPCQRVQVYAFCYAFSVTLLVLIVIERVLNTFATLLASFIWCNVTSAGSNFEVFCVISSSLSLLLQQFDVQDRDLDAQAHYAIEVHTSPWLHSTRSKIKDSDGGSRRNLLFNLFLDIHHVPAQCALLTICGLHTVGDCGHIIEKCLLSCFYGKKTTLKSSLRQ